MATTIITHCRLGIVDPSGNVNILYPQTTGADVSITPTTVVNQTTLQGLVDALKASAFISNFSGIDDTTTTSLVTTYSAKKIYDLIQTREAKNFDVAKTIGGSSRTTLDDAFDALTDSNYLEDSLTSDSTTKALTAAQGKALNQTLESKIGEVTVKTLASNATTISFTVPTTGNNLIDFWCSDGSNYTEIDTSVSGTVTLTFEPSASARSVSCRIAAVYAS